MTKWVGPDADPMNVKCDACGAEVAEPCRPGCIGKAQYDEQPQACFDGTCDCDDDHAGVLGRTTGGSTLVRAEDIKEN